MGDIEIPPTPFTVEVAKQQANDLAYGFEKHTGDYWNALYAKDPDYAWRRMLGWQAGGDDVARFGAYAIPPSPWHGTPVDPPVIVTPPPPIVTPPEQLDRIEAALADLKGLIITVALRPAPVYTGVAHNRYFGDTTITLKEAGQ